jgi:hypothetical protein
VTSTLVEEGRVNLTSQSPRRSCRCLTFFSVVCTAANLSLCRPAMEATFTNPSQLAFVGAISVNSSLASFCSPSEAARLRIFAGSGLRLASPDSAGFFFPDEAVEEDEAVTL